VKGLAAAGVVLLAAAATQAPPQPLSSPPSAASLLHTDEAHLRNLRQLTSGGENAEAYWSPDGKSLIYQHSGERVPCDQEFVMDVASGESRRVSNGQGKTTCGYFLSSNHPDAKSRNFDLYLVRDDSSGLERVTTDPTFDGFPMFSPDGRRLVFASNRGAKARGETNLFVADWVE